MDRVRQFLQELRLGSYAPAFQAKGYDDADFLMQLDADEALVVAQTVGMKPGHAHKYAGSAKRGYLSIAKRNADMHLPSIERPAMLAAPGLCGATEYGVDCQWGSLGALHGVHSMDECAYRCSQCDRCRVVSFSKSADDCSWYSHCDTGALLEKPTGYTTRRANATPVPSMLDMLWQDPWPRPPSNAALRHFAHRLKHQTGPLRVAVYGTSVSDGAYPRLFVDGLRRRFPHANLSLSVRAYPGAHLSFMRNCVDSMMPESADLYVLESVSEGLGKPPPAGQTGASADDHNLQHLVGSLQRRVLGARHCAPAVILLSTLDQIDCVRRLKRMQPFKGMPRDERAMVAEFGVCLDGERSAGAAPLTSPMGRVSAASGHPWVSMRGALRGPFRRMLQRGDTHPSFGASGGAGGALAVLHALVRDYLHLTRSGGAGAAEPSLSPRSSPAARQRAAWVPHR